MFCGSFFPDLQLSMQPWFMSCFTDCFVSPQTIIFYVINIAFSLLLSTLYYYLVYLTIYYTHFLRIFKFYIILMLYVGMSEEQIYVYDSRETDSNRMELYQQMEVIVCIANYVLSKSGIICQT